MALAFRYLCQHEDRRRLGQAIPPGKSNQNIPDMPFDSTQDDLDNFFMKEALKQACLALEEKEVPVGAVITWKDRILARACNFTEKLTDATAHAEMQAITAACNAIGGKYLKDCTLYVTLEPCPMCAGALFWAQIGRIVYGASDPKRGYTTLGSPILHPRTEVRAGVMEAECAGLLRKFFKEKRS